MSTNPPPASTPAVPARRARLVWLIALAVGVLVLDQLTKAWALSGLEEGVRHPVLGDALGIQLLFNPGAALGLATGTTWLLTLIALVVIVVIVRVSRRLGSTGWAIALGLLLGGAVGNLIDRLVREPGFGRGHVIDFIAYGNLFVGNVADIAIVVAAGLLMILSFRGVRLDGSREDAAAQHVAEPEPVAEHPVAEGSVDTPAVESPRDRADG
jgi:signal peptidase II